MRPAEGLQSEIDSRADHRLLLLSSLLLGSIFAIGASFQSVLVLDKDPLELGGDELAPLLDFLLRLAINAIGVVTLSWGIAAVRLLDRSMAVSACLAFGISLLGIFARARQLATVRATEALHDLQQEELRVRRDVADTLHGTMQQRLVALRTMIDRALDELDETPSAESSARVRERLRALSGELDGMRENELRALSASLYPEALDRGIVPALRALASRIPPSIAVGFDVSHAPSPDGLSQEERLLLVRVAEEGISNALRHGEARAIELRLGADEGVFELEVRHRGLAPSEPVEFSGLARFRDRLHDRDGSLVLRAEADGAMLHARLPTS